MKAHKPHNVKALVLTITCQTPNKINAKTIKALGIQITLVMKPKFQMKK